MSDTGIHRIYRHESTQFTTVPNWVVRDPDYNPNVFRLLAYLLSHSDGYELTYSQIERQTTLGRYAINQAAKFLIQKGWLEWNQEKGVDGRWLAKQWIIKDPERIAPVWNDSIVEPFRSGTINGHKEEQSIKKNTSKEKQTNTQELFEEFWNAYPRKLDKAKAFRAFKSAITRAKFEDILAGVVAYRNDPKRNPDFTKYPATWLNSDSWENAAAIKDDVIAADTRRKKEQDRTKEFIEEQERLKESAAPPPKCEHGRNLALCPNCSKKIS
jgi:predicted transcriptional regulator